MAVKNDRQHIIYNPDSPYVGIRACRDNLRRVAMNVNTGRIYTQDELKKLGLDKLLKTKDSDFIPVDFRDMTEKQKENMQVNKNDNKSKLGKTWTELRKNKKELQKQIKKGL